MSTHPSNNRYFLGVGLPEPENAFLAALKQQFRPEQHLSSPPHITLKAPFLMPNFRYLLEKLHKWSRYQEPFTVVLDRIGSFRQRKYATVFLDLKSSEKIKHLESSLSEEIPLLPRAHQFHPHLTLAQRVPFDDLAEVKTQLRAIDLKVKILVQSVALYQQGEDKQWQQRQEFFFGEMGETAEKHRT